MKIIRITENSAGYVLQIQQLLKQLTTRPINFTSENLSHIISNKGSYLFGAIDENDDNQLGGILTLLLYHIPTGFKAHIDDVVVDVNERGKGIGEKLMREAMKISAEAGVPQISLTSHPRREAANRLYQRLGFELFETNVYTLTYFKSSC